MYATDFQFDNEMASDYGLRVCFFDSNSGFKTVSMGSQLSFTTVQSIGTDKLNAYGSSYSEMITATFQVCKMDNHCDLLEITPEEFSKINRWLNRKTYKKFKVSQEDYDNMCFYGSFNTQSITFNEKIYGIELTFTSNRPYALLDEIDNNYEGTSFMIYNHSDEIGDLYPKLTITCLGSGKLSISNDLDNEVMSIENCVKNEVLTIDCEHKIITSSVSSHDLANDFNYAYMKLVNTYSNRTNNITSTLNIKMNIKYSPVRKVGI